MPPFKDLTGNRYGRLVVVKRVENLGKDVAYLCQCDCGKEKVVRGKCLRDGGTNSCGCYHDEVALKNRADSIKKNLPIKNEYSFDGDVGKCSLKDGRFFIFDADDYDKIKDFTWSIWSNGYACNKKLGLLHRYVLGYPDGNIDHINTIRTDNRKCNLRVCDQSENMANRGPQKNNAYGYKGITLVKTSGRYLAQIAFRGTHYNLGRFDTAEEAAHAYDRKAIELHGKFANLNFPLEYYEEKKEVK